MIAPLDRWRGLSESAKYRSYTRWSLECSAVVVGVTTIVTGRHFPSVIAAATVTMLAAVLAFESRPELTGRNAPRRDQRLAVGSALAFLVAWICGLLVRTFIDEETARAVGWLVVGFASLSSIAFAARRWLIAAGLCVVTALAYGSPAGYLRHMLALALIAAFCLFLTRLSVWALRVVDDLDKARETQAQLDVAEERLRFARDLHDVVGRGFSTIAVKSELASRLSRAGAAERAAAEMDEVKAVAVSSMEEMRSLVRGYRGIDLTGEIAGARSLLAAAGCRLVVEGDADSVPRQFHEAAAWVVREGTTNIVRHSSATAATLTLGPAGMSLTNDGATAVEGEHSGLRGLAERLDHVGSHLATAADDGRFTLEIRWEKA
ncbi:sensor histidine kinase [Gordonia humi]|uniref:Two-component system sensor histidine kinase DesK n=1 Tax=Gordonia humi TaxID=686429 RepID=A0A840EWH3_9ACTN|nr:two-component system sensor histidine kinase DesK [Gordonia humi]